VPEARCIKRRFVLLGGETYYAKGGFCDFISSHNTLKEALLASDTATIGRYNESLEWWQVWDCETNSLVAWSECQAYGSEDGCPCFHALDEEVTA
jgi:hypothetical protein